MPIAIMVIGQLFGKIGAARVSLSDFHLLQFLNPFTLAAFACLLARGFIWIVLFRKFDLAFIYPFMSISYIIIVLVSHVVFGEALTFGKGIGGLLIMAGVSFISIGERENRKGQNA